ncbi:MAG: DeoR family transcriptional regulator [Minisyncoccales bacterium]
MDKKFLIDLTCELYRLTLLFPKKEPLRYKMREAADDILANWLEFDQGKNYAIAKNLSRMLEVLDGFLEVALAQNWVKSSEILAIKERYGKVREILEKDKNQAKEGKKIGLMVRSEKLELMPMSHNRNNSSFIERQKKILAFIKENGQAQVWQIKQIFPEISKRTLRRDFEIMFKKGILERIGEKNNTFYQLKTS